MSGTKYRDRETKKVVTLTPDEASRLAGVRKRGTNEARFVPISGTSEVAYTDAKGKTSLTKMDPDALSRALRRNERHFTPIGDSNREALTEKSKVDAEMAAWAELADQQVAETFVGNLLPGARALDRLQMTPEDRAQDAMLTRLQDEQNPLAAGLGTGLQLLGTSLVPIPGLGAGSGLFKAGKGVRSATSLLGFADEAGQALTRTLGGGTAAKLAGRVGAGGLVNLPLSVQFQAAQAVDYDKPLAAEAFTRELGIHMLLGAAIDIAIPGAAAVLRGGAKGAKAVSPLNIFRKASDFVSARHILRSDKFTVTEKAAILGGRAKQLRGNTARRMVQREAAEEVADAATIIREATREISPSKLKANAGGTPQAASARRMEQAIDDLADGSPEWASVKEGFIGLAGLPKAVNTAGTAAEKSMDTLVGYLRTPNLPKTLSIKGKGRAVELRAVANNIREELRTLGKSTSIADDLEKLVAGATHDKDAVWQVFKMRNRLVANSLTGDAENAIVTNSMKRHVDNFLSKLSDEMAETIGATDVVFDAIRQVRGGQAALRSIDDHVTAEAFGAGRMSAQLRSARAAAELLESQGVVLSKDLKFVGTQLEGADTMLRKLAGRFETAANMNALRKRIQQEGLITTPKPLPGGEETSILGQVEAAGKYLGRVGTTIEEGIAKAIGRRGKHGAATSPAQYGVFQFRTMESLEEKREAYEALRERVYALTASDDELIGHVENLASGLQDDPELASAVTGQAVRAAQYLRSHMPQSQQGIIPTRAPATSPSEITQTLEIAGALDDPISVLDSALQGSLRTAGLDAVRAVFPHALSDMRVQLAESLLAEPATYASIPYRIRLDIDKFLGGGFEPSASPRSLVTFGNRAAQTAAQEQSLRGGTPQKQEPATASDRLAAF